MSDGAMTPLSTLRAGAADSLEPVEAKKYEVDGRGVETETTLAERIEVGLLTAEPGLDALDAKNVIVMERQPIRSGAQVLRFVTDRRPTRAGIDPYNYYIDRNSRDNVRPLVDPE
jgi:ABC-2 type transport system permease protein